MFNRRNQSQANNTDNHLENSSLILVIYVQNLYVSLDRANLQRIPNTSVDKIFSLSRFCYLRSPVWLIIFLLHIALSVSTQYVLCLVAACLSILFLVVLSSFFLVFQIPSSALSSLCVFSSSVQSSLHDLYGSLCRSCQSDVVVPGPKTIKKSTNSTPN